MSIISPFNFYLFIYLFIYLWLCWVFVSVRGLSPVAASGGLSLSWPLLLRSTGSRHAGSVIVAHGPSCSKHGGSFQTRARTRFPCIGRQMLNHCATREAQACSFSVAFFFFFDGGRCGAGLGT